MGGSREEVELVLCEVREERWQVFVPALIMRHDRVAERAAVTVDRQKSHALSGYGKASDFARGN